MSHTKEFARRRRRLLKTLTPGSVAILATSSVQLRNRDNEYPFRPDSDFFYLTGFPEPEALLVLVPGRKEGEYLLFCRDKDPAMELWTGSRVGTLGAKEHYGANEAYPIAQLDEVMLGLLENRSRIYYTLGTNASWDERVLGWINQVRRKARGGVQAPGEFIGLDQLIHEMRLRKSPSEIRLMEEAARITSEAHCRAMGVCRPGCYEYQLEAELLHTFIQRGARSPAYPSIVGGGSNACTLHYTTNDCLLQDGDLVLIDAGCEYQGYAADITRTFPVNGRFSDPQRRVYDWVLAAQQAAIAQVKSGKSWNDPHEAAVKVLTQGLVELGLLTGKVKTLIKEEKYKRFYMHRTGHWLGMDVHDVGSYRSGDDWRLLEPGMVMTVEPGLYIPGGQEDIPQDYWDIGIRIEDDVLVTEGDPVILTGGVPKETSAIEALMAKSCLKGRKKVVKPAPPMADN